VEKEPSYIVSIILVLVISIIGCIKVKTRLDVAIVSHPKVEPM